MQFSSGIRQGELTSVACILCSLNESLSIITRSHRRSFPLLILWFEENWTMIEHVLPLVALCDESEVPINFLRERQETGYHRRQ
jgi:hypothetical protein